jgi:transposase
VRMQNKMAGLLMESGTAFHKDKLRGKKYFTELMKSLEEGPESVKEKDFGETNEKYPHE